MVIEKGEKVHVIYRALFENSSRRHFVGEVLSAEGAVCRLEGFVFVYDTKSSQFVRKTERRITIIDVSESGYITNFINREVNLEQIVYRYSQGQGLVATDERTFSLNINEFGSKS